jgi:predicted phage gp36 major capsid-like protein
MISNPGIGARVGFDTERTVTGPFTGIAQNLGTVLAYPAVMMVLDNQSTVAIQFVVNGAVWKTFSAGEALVLDLRGNAAHAPTFAADANTQFQVIGTGGTGIFSLSVIYAR